MEPSEVLKHIQYQILAVIGFYALNFLILKSIRHSDNKLLFQKCMLIFILLLSSSIVFTSNFPGVYTEDSIQQLRQAFLSEYADWHPPVMAWLWALFLELTGQPSAMFVLHFLFLYLGATFWSFFFLRTQGWPVALLLPILITYPIFINYTGAIWKDVGFAYCLLSSSGIIAYRFISNKREFVSRAIAVMLLVYGVAIRPNGALAVLPLLIPIFSNLMSKANPDLNYKTLIRPFISSAIFIICLLVALNFFTYQILKTERKFPAQSVQLYDLAGISLESGIDPFPDYIKNNKAHNLDSILSTYSKTFKIHGNAGLLIINSIGYIAPIQLTEDASEISNLNSSWIKAIFSQPLAYLKHRFNLFNFLMSERHYTYEVPQSHTDRNNLLRFYEIPYESEPNNLPLSKLSILLIRTKLLYLEKTFIYSGWLWLSLLSLIFLYSLIRKQKVLENILALQLSISGILYILPYFVISPGSDFRYIYWSCIAGTIALILTISDVIKLCFSSRDQQRTTNVF